jgi:hypothetical protein
MKFLHSHSLSIIISATLIFACGSRKNTSVTTTTSTQPSASVTSVLSSPAYFKFEQDSINYFIKKPSDSAAYTGKVNVVFKLEFLKFGFRDYQIYQHKEFTLDRESDLITFNDVVGVKFYRITAIEFGQVKNYFKYKIFAYEQGVWLVVTEQEQFAEMSLSKQKTGKLSKEATATSVSSEKFNCAFSYSFLKPETP